MGEIDRYKQGVVKRSAIEKLKGSLNVSRSAPTSPNTAEIVLTWDEEAGRSVKRRRDDSLTTSKSEEQDRESEKMAEALRKLIRSIDKEIRTLSKMVKDNINTKKEIKETTLTLRSLSSRLMTTEYQGLLAGLGRGTSSSAVNACNPVEDAGTQTEGGELVEAATQTTKWEGGINVDDFLYKIQKCNDSEVTDLINERWPKSAFRKTILEKEGSTEEEADQALFTSTRCDDEACANVKIKYPELDEDEVSGDGYGLSSMRVNKKIRNGRRERLKERYIYKIEVREQGETAETDIVWGKALREWRNLLVEDNRKVVKVIVPGCFACERLRKLIEIVLADMKDILIKVCAADGNPNVEENTENKRRGREENKES